MNDAQLDELVLLMAYDFEALADAARPYRGITTKERRELVQWLKLEFRRLARAGGDKHGPCVVDRTRRVVPMVARPAPHLAHGMGVPACLLRADTAAALARAGLPPQAFKRAPSKYVERDYS